MRKKIAFINDQDIFCYKMMLFGLKNTGATYLRMMTKVFEGMISQKIDMHIDNIIAKIP